MIFNTAEIANSLFFTLHQKILARISEGGDTINLHIAIIGEDLSSLKYANKKMEMGRKLGINVILHKFDENDEAKYIYETLSTKILHIKQKNNGLIVQLPISDPSTWQQLKNSELFGKQFIDVDMLGNKSSLELWDNGFLPPTISAIDLTLQKMLTHSNWLLKSLAGKNVGVVGQGQLVGFNMLRYLKDCGATIFSVNKNTKNIADVLKQCDVIISAAGVVGLINSSCLKPDVIVIDAATSECDGKLKGDLDMEEISLSAIANKCMICPSPRGIGPLTVLCLFENLINLSKN
jgi:methylenetetrahydrofolate dehydrogenase (NADP+) / methenyltetrahydrofolate cyclohydrolase